LKEGNQFASVVPCKRPSAPQSRHPARLSAPHTSYSGEAEDGWSGPVWKNNEVEKSHLNHTKFHVSITV